MATLSLILAGGHVKNDANWLMGIMVVLNVRHGFSDFGGYCMGISG